MTVTGTTTPQTTSHRVAGVISEAFSPLVVLPMCTLVVSLHASSSVLAGLVYGAVAVFFAVGFPYAVLLSWVRSGRVADREIRDRVQRPAIMLITLASVSLGLAALWVLHVPRDLFAHMAAMVAGLATTLAITTRWKVSIHTACLAGAIVSVALLLTQRAAVLAALLPLLAWSRMSLKHHSLMQTAVGAVAGAVVAGAVLSLTP